MKKVLLTSAVALVAFGAVQAVSADSAGTANVQGHKLDDKVTLVSVKDVPAKNGVNRVFTYSDGKDTFTSTTFIPNDKGSGKVEDKRVGTVYHDRGYGTPSYTKGTVTITVVDLSTGKPVAGATVDFLVNGKPSSVTTGADGVAKLTGVEPDAEVRYRLNVPAGYEQDQDRPENEYNLSNSFQGKLKAIAGDIPVTFSIRPATVRNDRRTIHPAKPGQSYGDAVKSAWVKDAKGQWNYLVDEQGTKATGWKQIDGKWYFFNAEGAMQKWWVKVGNTWYYLNGSGEMQTGWLQDGGKWYFLEASGAMKASQWFQVKDKWYHVDGSGALSVNTTVDGYTVNGNGEWV